MVWIVKSPGDKYDSQKICDHHKTVYIERVQFIITDPPKSIVYIQFRLVWKGGSIVVHNTGKKLQFFTVYDILSMPQFSKPKAYSNAPV